MENLEFKERIVELINRSNQLNYTQSRTDLETLTTMMLDNITYNFWSVFAWDKYGYYGLIGFALIEQRSKLLIHFVFSCRAMHMGIEDAMLKKITSRYPEPDCAEFKIPLPALSEDWLVETKFLNHEIRTMIRKNEMTTQKQEIKIKIMYGCMSGGMAYYSRYRDMMDFDGAWFDQPKRFLCLRNLLVHPADVSRQYFPHALVYGTAFDYYHSSWALDGLSFGEDSFSNGVYAFCKYFQNNNHQLLVVLPPDNMPDNYYRLGDSNTREITAAFNDIWQKVSHQFPYITLLNLSAFATPQDMPDTAHYYAKFMQKIAQYIDAWYESINNNELQISLNQADLVIDDKGQL